jgi:hypothetical protein
MSAQIVALALVMIFATCAAVLHAIAAEDSLSGTFTVNNAVPTVADILYKVDESDT